MNGSDHLTLAQLRPETRIAIDAVEQAQLLAVRGEGASRITSKGGRDLVTACVGPVRHRAAAARL